MSGRLRIVAILAVSLPAAVTMLALHAVVWSGLWSAANLAWGMQRQNPAAVSRGLSAASFSLGVLGHTAGGWGAVLQHDSRLTTVGKELMVASRTAGAAAPVAPQMLGFDRTVRYMVSALNDAELFGSGGAPLDLAIIEVDRGTVRVVESGSAGQFNPLNAPYAWPVTGSEPWYRPGREYPFANSNFHPDFRISGTNMVSAWGALGQFPVDGVLTVDVTAVATVLRAIGPLDTEGYGRLTGDNVIRRVLVDSYRELPVELPGAMEERQRRNSEFRSALIARMSEPVTAIRALVALWSAVPARHVQSHMADPDWQAVVTAAGAQASLATEPGDLLGVFIQSGVSKLAVFQIRRIVSDVEVRGDGSADVRQTVSFVNDVPVGLTGDQDAHKGYLALIFRQRAAFRMPANAMGTVIEVAGARPLVAEGETGPFPDEVGGAVLWQGQDIRPGQTSTTTVRYTLPAGTFGTEGRLTYHLTANPQAMVHPASLEVNVRFLGGSAQSAEGWQVADGLATWRGTLDRTLSLRVTGPR